eukprot:CAMPEP_0113485708 /NCGR_PEP_ID=MMETSP0014_2-20120614/24623_1 /TAXON_ID=2857 /ORGANISM="Nitzschia sp." /LENGTH=318 /DNA_ID=CAMNT_0000379363 /DNA_START=80 /DNA_END=1036 /DNA_ORIENTATION=- /assembly_acc=CAM_ASM_000159
MTFIGWLSAMVVAVVAVLGTTTHSTNNVALALQSPYPQQRSNLFVMPSRPSSSLSTRSSSFSSAITQLCAKKRRRRKDRVDTTTTQTSNEESANTPEQEEGPSTSSMMSTSDLPDFDMDDDPDSASSSSSLKPKRRSSSSSSSSSVGNLETITPEMMGSQGAGEARSIDQLISDRSLEQRFEFDGSDVDENIPDFVELAAKSSSSSSSTSSESLDISSMIGGGGNNAPIGKKKQRQAERRANAINRAKEEADAAESAGGLFNIPFFSPEKDQVSGIKILENGAWVGIGILIVWELYLNSPLFDRAAPLAPVVFEDLFM